VGQAIVFCGLPAFFSAHRTNRSVRLVALALILGCTVALAQPRPETVSGVFQVVVAEELGKGVPEPPESIQYSLVTGTETLRLRFDDPQDAAKIATGSLLEATGRRAGKQFTIPADKSLKAGSGPHVRTMSGALRPKNPGATPGGSFAHHIPKRPTPIV
jgi:hypothetical protein